MTIQEIYMQVRRTFFAALAACAMGAVLAGCGGGGSDSASTPKVDPRYLAKYQGSWIEQCASQISFPGGVFGPASMREKITISAPDANGKILIEQTTDFFDTTLSCYDQTTVPYATMTALRMLDATFARLEAQAGSPQLPAFDVLIVNQPESGVSATGTGISSQTVNGAEFWRVTFSDGRFHEESKVLPAASGELSLMPLEINGIPNSAIVLNSMSNIYLKAN
jgi:hypothetical protein